MTSIAASVGVPATAAVGCSAATRSSADAPSLELALDVGREVEEVRQLERERLLARSQRARVRAQRCEHALHGVQMLVLILRAGRECERSGGVGIRVRAARRGAGQHPRGDRAARDGHERLGARADETVDGEGPAVGVADRECPGEPAQVGARRNGARPGRARARPCSPRPRRSRRVRRGPRPGSRSDSERPGRASPTSTVRTPCAPAACRARRPRSASCVMRVTHDRPPRRPTTIARHDEHAARRRPGSNANAPNATRPGPGQAHLVIDLGRGRERAPAGREVEGARRALGEPRARADCRRTPAIASPRRLQKRRMRGRGVDQHVVDGVRPRGSRPAAAVSAAARGRSLFQPRAGRHGAAGAPSAA